MIAVCITYHYQHSGSNIGWQSYVNHIQANPTESLFPRLHAHFTLLQFSESQCWNHKQACCYGDPSDNADIPLKEACCYS